MVRGRHARKKQISPIVGKTCAMMASIAVIGGMTPSAYASPLGSSMEGSLSEGGASGYIVSTRSFPKANAARVTLFDEAVSVDTDDGTTWSLGEGQTAEDYAKALDAQADAYDKKIAEEKAHREQADRERQEKEARERRERETVERQDTGEAAASRSQYRAAIPADGDRNANANSNPQSSSHASTAPASAKGKAILDGALSLIGGSMDCTMLATLALQKGTGIYYHGWPEDYRNFPGAVETSWKDAQPGDILVYRDGSSYDMNGLGHADHVAIYAGNGMAVHGGWSGGTVALAAAVTVQGIPEHVYRVQ